MSLGAPGGVPAPYVRPKPPPWLWMVPLFSFGFLAFVPPIVLATKLRTTRAWQWAAAFAVGDVVGFTLVGLDDATTGTGPLGTIGTVVVVATGIGAVVYGQSVAPRINWGPEAPTMGPPTHDPNPAAVAGIVALRRKRAEARKLAARDPRMARELRIGRPDLPRSYDDGGLVDVNTAPAEVIATHLGLSAAQASSIVEARQQLGRFERVDDLLNLVGMDVDAYEQAEDRILVL